MLELLRTVSDALDASQAALTDALAEASRERARADRLAAELVLSSASELARQGHLASAGAATGASARGGSEWAAMEVQLAAAHARIRVLEGLLRAADSSASDARERARAHAARRADTELELARLGVALAAAVPALALHASLALSGAERAAAQRESASRSLPSPRPLSPRASAALGRARSKQSGARWVEEVCGCPWDVIAPLAHGSRASMCLLVVRAAQRTDAAEESTRRQSAPPTPRHRPNLLHALASLDSGLAECPVRELHVWERDGAHALEWDALWASACALRGCRSAHLAPVLGVARRRDRISLITEHLAGPSLLERVLTRAAPPTEDSVRPLFRALARALRALLGAGVPLPYVDPTKLVYRTARSADDAFVLCAVQSVWAGGEHAGSGARARAAAHGPRAGDENEEEESDDASAPRARAGVGADADAGDTLAPWADGHPDAEAMAVRSGAPSPPAAAAGACTLRVYELFAAPELLDGSYMARVRVVGADAASACSAAAAAAAFSVGAMLCALLLGCSATADGGRDAWAFTHAPRWHSLSPALRELLTGLLQPLPEMRWTLEAALAHAWMAPPAGLDGEPAGAAGSGADAEAVDAADALERLRALHVRALLRGAARAACGPSGD